jgi:aminopeptidase
MDPRIRQLSSLLIDYSCKIQPGERVLISYIGQAAKPLIRQLIKDIYARGGLPFLEIHDAQLERELLLGCNEEQLTFHGKYDMLRMKGMQAFIGVRAPENIAENADVSSEKQALYSKMTNPVLRQRVDHTKWVILRYPTPAMAQLLNTSQEDFEDFFFNVCTLDYEKMDRAMNPLVDLMQKTDQVRLIGPGTDLSFSIKNIPAIKCSGERNIPDGEVYTAPLRESMNGRIRYNTPSELDGFTYENIDFEVRDGRIVNATANDTKRVNQLLDTDQGARYFGEFAIGVNPYILTPMKETLFDEKIAGSFHLTPGCAYDDSDNGNRSAIHWDLVNIQRPEYGGGEIWFDGVLIRKDGLFVLPELEGLNPENLK